MKSKVYPDEIRLMAPSDLRRNLEAAARRRETTMSELVRVILRDGLQRLTDGRGPPSSGLAAG